MYGKNRHGQCHQEGNLSVAEKIVVARNAVNAILALKPNMMHSNSAKTLIDYRSHRRYNGIVPFG
jgi:hypothetical protein